MKGHTTKKLISAVQLATLCFALPACGKAAQTSSIEIPSQTSHSQVVSSEESRLPTGDGTAGNIFVKADGENLALTGDSITFSVPRAQPEQNKWHDKMVADVNKCVGAEIVWEWNDPDTYYTEVEKRYQTGEVADLLYVKKTDAFLEAVEAGLFWDLGPYLDEYENLAMLSEAMRLGGSYNGKVYALPSTQNVGYVLTYRLDWLNQLQLAEPKDWESFCDMLYAFAYNDPDGNGKNDTVGLYLNNNSEAWDTMEVWFGVPNVWGIDEKGDLIHKTRTEEYRQAYRAFRELYTKGMINNGSNGVPDFRQVEEISTIYESFSDGAGGSTIDMMQYANAMHTRLVGRNVIGEEEKIYALRAGVDTGAGNLCCSSTTIEIAKMLAVSTKRIKTEEQLRQVLQVLDALHSPGCVTLVNHGWEGVSYVVDENNYHVSAKTEFYTEEENKEFKEINSAHYNFSAVLLRELSDKNDTVKTHMAKGTLEESLSLPQEIEQYGVLNYGAQYTSPTEKAKGAELDAMLNTAEVQYITGEIDDAGFEAALNAWWENGGKDITAEKNEKYHEVGD